MRTHPLADPPLARAAAVRVAGVEPRDPGVPGAVHDRERLVVRDPLSEERRRRADATEVPAAESNLPHSGRFICVNSFRTSHSSGKNE